MQVFDPLTLTLQTGTFTSKATTHRDSARVVVIAGPRRGESLLIEFTPPSNKP
jgi:hypothetical protein